MATSRRLLSLLALCCIALLVAPALAGAHPALRQAAPAPGLVAPGPVEQVDLVFSEGVVPEASRVTLERRGGDEVALGDLSSRGPALLSVATEEPLGSGVYQVTWSVLGADGHRTGGRFGFAVPEANGDVPSDVQALFAVGRGGGPGEQSAAGEPVLTVVARWAGLLGASVLLGGLALLALARRRRSLAPEEQDAAERRWRKVALPAWIVVALASLEAVRRSATAGAGGGLDFDALFASPTGRAAFAVLLTVAVTGALAAIPAVRARGAGWPLLAAGALALLVGQALGGHVQTLQGGEKAFAAATQIVHLLGAGIWLGGLVLLAVVGLRRSTRGPAPYRPLVRAFVPLASVTFGLATVTGVLAAVREVEALYFLRWSSYGTVVILKAALVLAIGIAAGITLLLMRRGVVAKVPLRAEALVAVAVLALAATLSGLVPGRGQPLPAERDNLLPGPAIASAISADGPLRLTLAPARRGENLVSVVRDPAPGTIAPPAARRVTVDLFNDRAGEPVRATLRRGAGGTWSANVDLPSDGAWYARVAVGGQASPPVALTVGVPEAAGPGPVTVLAVADLSGAGARHCRAHLLGVEMAVGRLNALGGVDGGRKVALLALDDGGSPERSREVAGRALGDPGVVALVGACGTGAGAAVEEASAFGVPSIVADPAVPLVARDRVFRLAPDPFAEGFAGGQLVASVVGPDSDSRVIRAVRTGEPDNLRRIAGLQAAVQGSDLTVEAVEPARLAEGPAALRQLIDRGNAAAVLIDGDPTELARQLLGLGRARIDFAPAVLIASSPVLSERLISDAGAVARIGAVVGASEVSPDSATAAAYARALLATFPGETPTLDGLRGYNAGLALSEAVEDGIGHDGVADRLLSPPKFSDALATPWRSDAPAAGNQRFGVICGTFLPANLIPPSAGGETYTGTYFADGTWTRVTNEPLGPPFRQAVAPLE